MVVVVVVAVVAVAVLVLVTRTAAMMVLKAAIATVVTGITETSQTRSNQSLNDSSPLRTSFYESISSITFSVRSVVATTSPWWRSW